MIKINLVAERKQAKTKSSPGLRVEGGSGAGRSVLLVAILLVGVLVSVAWWWKLDQQHAGWVEQHAQADQELKRLEEIREKADRYKEQKELLAQKINLIKNLKKRQAVPVQIIDQISRNLPDFLWLESMSAKNNQINLSGRATTYNAVSNLYANLNDSGFFQDVSLGRTFEVPEGVSFSLTCRFATPGEAQADEESKG